ncbi:winged helix-turn-helix domain-containing protein [Cellulomonas fengjieae]|uniref:YcaQ family DNA glycosylase n=1 Tax=Cellulomonas fengjieae TaxID=2819978 RepID=A0ABS3SDR7_9CELL|nr:crosslink repair DNA glycosylase YcaQ family protein [Cellulomonas fengjieae]MBO3083889.1 YcaQ family DNA glycosylase [Cellulomonas fengjieae]QVI64828.1 YcaQ family DNA glycosylase [Cellulomonas fengjieae]
MIPSLEAERLSLSQARRITLRAQGLDRPRPLRPAPPTMRQFQQVVDRLGVLQIDSVNVLARAHLMPAYSRLGAYDPALLDRASGRAPRRLVETWAHVASFVPPETYRLLGWRQRAYLTQDWGVIEDVSLKLSPLVEEVRAIIAERGPLTARQVQADFEAEHPTTRGEWGWNWSVAKRVLEYLFFTGEITSAGRNSAFERRYDLTSRVLPPHVLLAPEPSDDDAIRALVQIGARAHGIGTLRSIADYFRLPQERAARAVAELVEDGVLRQVTVDGWDQGKVWRHRDADLPRRASGRALLSPFDPLVFERSRLEALFGLRYRIEIYVPEPQRVWGYYVLPFLLGEALPALVDLKADRQAGILRVHAAHRATGSLPDADVVEPLAAELRELAGWLRLDDVVVGDRDGVLRGDLAPGLARAVRSA